MKEVYINTNEVESCWEKDNICFVKMKSGKVWLCEPYAIDRIISNKDRIVAVELTTKGSDSYGK